MENTIHTACNIISLAQSNPIFRQTFNLDQFLSLQPTLTHREIFPNNLNIAILGYKSDLVKPWDPFNTESGLPGSEEAAVYASQSLALAGHTVTLYMNPPESSIWSSVFSNPQWLCVDAWTSDTEIY